jgi:hypothetical protein
MVARDASCQNNATVVLTGTAAVVAMYIEQAT